MTKAELLGKAVCVAFFLFFIIFSIDFIFLGERITHWLEKILGNKER